MSASFFHKFNSLLPRPDSYQDLESFLEKKPRLVSFAALAVTTSVLSTGTVVLFFTGKQFLVIVVSAVLISPFIRAAMGGLIALYLKWWIHAPKPSTTVAPSRNQTVLLLEADPSLREIIHEGLTNAGFHLICALSAKHAARLCRDHGGLIDLLLADTNALGGRSLDCLQTIKATQPDLPVLLISAYDRQTLCERHTELLATYEFLPLPFEFPHLTETIDTLLQLQTRATNKPQTEGA
jgi:CheY-like chemotaxis protein